MKYLFTEAKYGSVIEKTEKEESERLENVAVGL